MNKLLTASALFLILLSTSRAAQNFYVWYVPDPVIPAPSQAEGIKVDIRQTHKAPNITCSFRVTNNGPKPIFLFIFGEGVKGMAQLPVAPLNWPHPGQGITPNGWSESFGGSLQNSTYNIGWQAKTPSDLLYPNGSQNFEVAFPPIDKFKCDEFSWNVRYAIVFREGQSTSTSLSIKLSELHLTPDKRLEGDVAIQNLGPNDTTINLGIKLGDKSYPDQLFLMARDSEGKTQRLRLAGEPAGRAGRQDPMVVPISKQSTYVVHAQWWPITMHAQWRPLTAGLYAVRAEFVGSPCKNVNPDMLKINLLNCWLGTVDSNEVTLITP